MRLLRFISEEEMEVLYNDEVVEPLYIYPGNNTTLGSEEVVYFLDVDKAIEYMELSNALPPGDYPDIEQIILFYDLLLAGIPDNDFAVIVEKEMDETVKIGEGDYGHPGYLYGDESIDIDDVLEIVEVGLQSYSLDDVKEIWKNTGNNDFEKIE